MPHDANQVPGRGSAIRLFTLLATSALAFSLMVYGQIHGLPEIFQHLLYIPIILAVYYYERHGLYFSLLLASLYVGTLYFFAFPDAISLTRATAEFITLIGIAVIVFYLVRLLRDRERRYHSIFRHSQAGIFVVDRRDLRIAEANRRAAEILGCRSGDLRGASLRSFWGDEAGVRAFLAELLENGAVFDHAATFTGTGGVRRHVVISAGALPGDDAVCTIVDITKQRRTEILLRGAAELSGMLVRERDAPDLLRRACTCLGSVREGIVIGIWLREGEELVPAAASDDDCLPLFSGRAAAGLIRRAFDTKEVVAGDLAGSPGSSGDLRAIPMMAGESVLGVFAVARTAGDRLSDDGVDILTALANDLAATLKLAELEEEKLEAYAQLGRNIEQFAILGDHIRNPLQVIVGLACMGEDHTGEEILKQASAIHMIIGRLDSGWIESAAIRDYLRRHP
jgi:PAS domain S-box-containing protein